ncbi:MAG: radical SAM protein [Candidatus Omnitrophica bacterium]|nr:radical SAM protein [Candidatus Omnitrophota bacterium]
MINITKLLCGLNSYGDILRYNPAVTGERKPVVVWNSTKRCNLSCVHCYADSSRNRYPGELSTGEAKEMLKDIAGMKAPVVLFSGGEPLTRPDIFELIAFSKSLGLRAVLSTNGTLITHEAAKKLKSSGLDYAGISLDGIGVNNDKFRARTGAFSAALSGIRNLQKAGQKAGLRFTLTKGNYHDLEGIFNLAEKEGIERVCFYHLVYSGRAARMKIADLSHSQTRQCVDSICSWVTSLHARGLHKEVLTVDNHADSVYIYLKVKKENPEKAAGVFDLLRLNGGNSSGEGIANVDNLGFVYPDQFWHEHCLGNVRERKFSGIWSDGSLELREQLRNRKNHFKGRCLRCRYLELCNGNFRARAEAVSGDMWEDDPACYLTDEEVLGGKYAISGL